MPPYDCRRMTLDPGLTALALRGLRYADRHCPFIEGHTRSRAWPPATIRAILAAWFPTLHSLVGARPPHPRGGGLVAGPRITDR
jgi:hypothetical protein